MHKVIV